MEGKIDSTFTTAQRDLFASGLVAEIGVNAFGVWSAIKYYADYKTGEADPGMRELGKKLGLSKDTVARAVGVLRQAHLVRIVKKGVFKRKGQTYIARERLAVRLGERTLCFVVVDYVPADLRVRIRRIRESLETGEHDQAAWAEVEIIPGPGFVWDGKTLKTAIRASEISCGLPPEEENEFMRLGEEMIALVAPNLARMALKK
ncbi:MAG TPA: hypothetical protein VMV97_03230 [Sulfuriferula sp.]|nr:hypothetical protein [Sulfuriferula sp.]